MTSQRRQEFDLMIGRLDRVLSEFLVEVELEIDNHDVADRQTLKHHADDLIGVGQKALKLIGTKT